MMLMVGGCVEVKDDEGNIKYRAVVQFHMNCQCDGNDMDSKICEMRSFHSSTTLFDTSDEAGAAAVMGAPAIAEKLGIVLPEGDPIFVDN